MVTAVPVEVLVDRDGIELRISLWVLSYRSCRDSCTLVCQVVGASREWRRWSLQRVVTHWQQRRSW
jgi:hypothetical protein